jgi:hypothetical protein
MISDVGCTISDMSNPEKIHKSEIENPKSEI